MWGIILVVIIFIIGFFWAAKTKMSTKKKGDVEFNFSMKRFGLVLLVTITLGIFLTSMIFYVGPGEVGVIFDPLGVGVVNEEAGEGWHIKAPWHGVECYNVKLQEYTDSTQNITNEGLYMGVDITVWYRIVSSQASVIRQEVGTASQYQNIVVYPQSRSSIRQVISSHDAIEVYGENRPLVEIEIFEAVRDALAHKNIIVERVLLRDVTLPATLAQAIEAKKQAEQEALQMLYVLERENKEAERKRIEAQGIADANDTIAGSLTMEYLEWYWISNLDSHDSVLYVPVGEYGLPLFREVGGDE